MREILFRGRDIAGIWRFGVPLIFTEDYVCITAPYTYNKSVVPETVGQYTGLTDKNGKKIFEGDIIQRLPKYKTDTVETYEVIFLEGSFQYVCLGKKYCYSFDDSEFGICSNQYDVIGNIHDNPELLGDK